MNRMHVSGVVILAILLLAPLAAELKKEDIAAHKLGNGLKIVLLEDHDIPNIAYYTFFRVGSRNERPGLTGVSHFIEHMMFNGTQKFGPGEFDRIMEWSGGANNAFTGEDMTGYTNWYPRTALESMVEMEADRMQGLIFDPKVLESERGVIASERRLSENNNESILDEVVQATAIMAHPYHWSVIGWMSDILSWRRDEIIAYYRTFYSPNNAVVVVVGDFETPRLFELIKKYYAAIPPGGAPPPVSTVEPEQLGLRRIEVHRQAQTPVFITAYHSPSATAPDFPAIQVLENILLRGESSRLYQKLVSETQLAVSVRGGAAATIDPMLFTIMVKPKADADIGRIEKCISEELERLSREGVSEKEMQKAKNAIRTSFYSRLQTISGKASTLGSMEIIYGSYEHLFTAMDKLAEVTAEQVKSACAKYLQTMNQTIGVVIPTGGDR